jgi:hypothetical protein
VDLDDGFASKGIDFLGRCKYGQDETTVILCICRIVRVCALHGFYPEDVVKIVLMHELAHFVTLLGTNSKAQWGISPEEDAREKEDVAQEATHLLLRVAGYGHLVQVFDALSQLCPCKYNIWRQRWKQQLKSNDLEAVLTVFRNKIRDLRLSPPPPMGDQHEFSGYE